MTQALLASVRCLFSAQLVGSVVPAMSCLVTAAQALLVARHLSQSALPLLS